MSRIYSLEQRAWISGRHDQRPAETSGGVQHVGDSDTAKHPTPDTSIYKPLPDPGYMRLLIVEPATWSGAHFECSIEVVLCHEDANYTAISYAWAMQDGDTSLYRDIYINSQTVAIRRNLFEALERLRYMHDKLRVWIDALCINQDDVDERTQQVSNMAAVYKNAKRVVAWLGQGRSHEDRATSLLLEQLKAIQSDDTCPEYLRPLVREAPDRRDQSQQSRILQLECWNPYIGTSFANYWTFENTLRNLEYFLDRRYFERRWIVQEMAHARHDTLELRWGEHEVLNLVEFREIIDVLWLSLQNVASRASSQHARLYTMREILMDKAGTLASILSTVTASTPQLPAVLDVCHKLRCSDTRDILYSLISIEPHCGIVPDYRLDVTAVSIRLTQYLLANGRIMTWMKWLSMGLRGLKLPRDPDQLPSWCLRLTDRFLFNPRDDDDPDASKRVTEAMQWSIDAARVLTCRLRYLGTVHELDNYDTTSRMTFQHKDTRAIREGHVWLPTTLSPQLIQPGDMVFTLPGVENKYKRGVLVLRHEGAQQSETAAFSLALIIATPSMLGESISIDGIYSSSVYPDGSRHIAVDDQDWPRPEVAVSVK